MIVARLKLDGKTLAEAIRGKTGELSVDVVNPMKILFTPRLVKAGLIIARNTGMAEKITVNPGIIEKLFLHAPKNKKNLEKNEKD